VGLDVFSEFTPCFRSLLPFYLADDLALDLGSAASIASLELALLAAARSAPSPIDVTSPASHSPPRKPLNDIQRVSRFIPKKA
jgi:hypothetical protein